MNSTRRGTSAALVAAVKKGGAFVSTLAQSAEQIGAEDITFVPVFANPSTATLERLDTNQAEKHRTVTVQRVYGLDGTTEAFGHFAGGTLGKLVVAID